MIIEVNNWITEIEECEVTITPLTHGEGNRLMVTIGTHAVYYMDEKLFDVLTDNLLKAKTKYIVEGKHEVTMS